MYSALMVFRHMKDVHDIAYDVARELLRENGAHEDWVDDYLSELIEFSMMRKRIISLEISGHSQLQRSGEANPCGKGKNNIFAVVTVIYQFVTVVRSGVRSVMMPSQKPHRVFIE